MRLSPLRINLSSTLELPIFPFQTPVIGCACICMQIKIKDERLRNEFFTEIMELHTGSTKTWW